MSKPGPAPKRDDERRRTNSPEHSKIDQSDLPFEVNLTPTIPEANEDWHPIARRMFESLKSSPSVMWMYDADWQLAYVLCEGLSRDLSPQAVKWTDAHWSYEDGEKSEYHPPEPIFLPTTLSGASLQAYLKGFGAFGVTEAERLRMLVEVPAVGSRPAEDAPEDPDGVVHSIHEARSSRLA